MNIKRMQVFTFLFLCVEIILLRHTGSTYALFSAGKVMGGNTFSVGNWDSPTPTKKVCPTRTPTPTIHACPTRTPTPTKKPHPTHKPTPTDKHHGWDITLPDIPEVPELPGLPGFPEIPLLPSSTPEDDNINQPASINTQVISISPSPSLSSPVGENQLTMAPGNDAHTPTPANSD